MTTTPQHTNIARRIVLKLRASARRFQPGTGGPADIDEELLQLSRRFSALPPERLVPAIDLETYLVQLIAHHDRVSEDAINADYIRQRREHDIYPDAVYLDLNGYEGSSYGGYDGTGLEHQTRREHDEQSSRLDEQLSRF